MQVQPGLGKDGLAYLIVEAALPDAHSVQDVSVEFMDSRLGGAQNGPQDSKQTSTLVLSVAAGWSQTVELPCVVDDSKCAAKFDKRKQVLRITVPKAGS